MEKVIKAFKAFYFEKKYRIKKIDWNDQEYTV